MKPQFLRREPHDCDDDSLLRVPVVVVYRWQGRTWKCSEKEWERMNKQEKDS